MRNSPTLRFQPTIMPAARSVCLLEPAGLSDRLWLYAALGGLLRAQNRTLRIPAKPCGALDAVHNFGRPVPCSDAWGAFVALPPHIRPRGAGDQCANWTNAQAYARLGKARPPPAPPLELACTGRELVPVSPKAFTLVHIRRGDVLRSRAWPNAHCTSVKVVANATRRLHSSSRRLVYTTNEQRAAYLRALHATMRGIAEDALFLDEHLARAAPRFRGNNFLTYCVYLRLAREAARTAVFGVGSAEQWRNRGGRCAPLL